MPQLYPFNSKRNPSNPSIEGLISTDAGEYEIPINAYHKEGVCWLAFYNINSQHQPVLVTPTAGTVTFRASYIEGQYLLASKNPIIQAKQVMAGNADYTLPVFHGALRRVKMTLSAIVGADYVRAYYHGY